MKKKRLREFYLHREADISGTSGTGVVARGVILESGKAVLEWVNSVHSSICIYSTIEDVELIHGHDGATKVIVGSPES